ncbi:MAG TPA: Smr/MutS family protein [Xanthobacteraceae bacterium]|nr:Smr/MutS family protein [Xanthobacteraceae bacterium]
MSGDADKGRPARRGLTPGERELWSSVTRSIAPLRRARPLRAPEPDEPEAAPPPKPPPPAPEIHMAAKPREKPALAPLDRRLRQRLARGREPIDATIDLHGLTQAEAHAALTHFLRRASAGDARLVLVITGKGGRGEDFADRGVLRRQVPLWLTSRELRDHVIGFDAAHVAHGGDGALYVRVRRGREREEPR